MGLRWGERDWTGVGEGMVSNRVIAKVMIRVMFRVMFRVMIRVRVRNGAFMSCFQSRCCRFLLHF